MENKKIKEKTIDLVTKDMRHISLKVPADMSDELINNARKLFRYGKL